MKVDIDPVSVIEKLIDESIGQRSWVFEKDGVFYRGHEKSAGQHSIEVEVVISKEKYDFVIALEGIKEYLAQNYK